MAGFHHRYGDAMPEETASQTPATPEGTVFGSLTVPEASLISRRVFRLE